MNKKLIALVLLSLCLISCGKQNQGSGPAGSESSKPPLIRGYVDATTAGETELLNVTTSENVESDGSRIRFLRSVNLSDLGPKHTCALSINSGEVWSTQLRSSSLEVTYQDGSKKLFRKLTSSPAGQVYGTWLWSGNLSGFRQTIRYSIFPNRLIINQDCEG